jgi:predicted permease
MKLWRSLLNRLFNKPPASQEEDFERELRAHLDLEAEEQEAAGLSSREARYAAVRAFGNQSLVKEDVRAAWRNVGLEQLLQDFRYALRGVRRSPAFAAVAIASLFLGVGAATAVFSVLNAVVLQPLPVVQPDRLVVLQPELRNKRFVLFNPLFEELRRTQHSLSGLFAVSDEPYLKAAFGREAPAFVRGSLVSGNYFRVLGVSPELGRLLTDEDDGSSSQTCAAVVSHAYWASALHSDPGVIGTPVVVREKACTIVGVAAAAFRTHEPGYSPDLWVPLRPLTDPKLLASRSMAFFSGVMGRLNDDTTATQAAIELTTLFQRMQVVNQASPRPGEPPTNPSDFRIQVLPGAQGLANVARLFGRPLTLAFAVAGIVLLIASVNVANLLLARGYARTMELATRAALGAGRARLIRMLAVEGAVVAIAGGLLGFTLAWLVAPTLSKAVSPPGRLISFDPSPDIRVFGVAAAATILAALLAGILPAFRLSGRDLQSSMAGAGRTAGSRAGRHLGRVLVAAQFALSLLLVTSAGLLLRSMQRVLAVDPGFDASQVVLLDVRDTEPSARFGETDTAQQKAQRAARYELLERRLNEQPGVRSASLSWLGLFGGSYVGLNTYDVEEPEKTRFTLVDYVTPRYFETIGMQLRRGRGFTEADREGSERVAIVNEAFVRQRVNAGREAIGRKLVMTYADDRRPFTIIGVVRDAKYNDLRERETEPMLWVPLGQMSVKLTSVALRVQTGSEQAVTGAARSLLTTISPDLMVRKSTTLRAQVDQATARERLLMRLSSGFGGLAILLAAVGLYGSLAYAVTRRTREIGIRLALGAQRGSVVQLMLRESLTVVAAAILVGVPLSLASGTLLKGFLFGVTAYDPIALLGGGAVLTVVAVLAAFAPARRASKVDPVLALRCE